MPVLLQASISSVPAGTVSFLPSTVRVTSAMKIAVVSSQLSVYRCSRFANQAASSAASRQFSTDTSRRLVTCSDGHGLPSRCASNSSRNF